MDRWRYFYLNAEHKKWILAGIALVSLVILLIILVPKGSGVPDLISCNLDTSKRPKKPPNQLLASGDFKSLVNISGFVEFIGPNVNQFVALNLKRVDKRPGHTNNSAKLFLVFECLTMHFNYQTDGSFFHIDETYLDWSSNNKLDNSSVTTSYCKTGNFGLFYDQDKRFSCLGSLVLGCMADVSLDSRGFSYRRPVARIVLDTLEFELDGNEKEIREKQFSKPPSLHGCKLEV